MSYRVDSDEVNESVYSLDGSILHTITMDHDWTGVYEVHHYYDINEWKRSVDGREGSAIVLDMTPTEIDYIKRKYLRNIPRLTDIID